MTDDEWGSGDVSPRELLAKAIDKLDPADRERVTAWLLKRSFGAAPTGHSIGTAIARETRDLMVESAMGGVRRGEHQVVPIRLPTAQHAALRDWCTEHGFTMATVVRGLVERFLEDRGRLPARAS
ncbi:MAG: hypothetical protein QOI74_960 [Micromonosporaceae bacterium]|jgi:hypothetical protein|nr:hypothetical protein [Micromonosporaceae bacterium]MDT5036438.1 hypothetical protein [Micromonosporaceae bacterium]